MKKNLKKWLMGAAFAMALGITCSLFSFAGGKFGMLCTMDADCPSGMECLLNVETNMWECLVPINDLGCQRNILLECKIPATGRYGTKMYEVYYGSLPRGMWAE